MQGLDLSQRGSEQLRESIRKHTTNLNFMETASLFYDKPPNVFIIFNNASRFKKWNEIEDKLYMNIRSLYAAQKDKALTSNLVKSTFTVRGYLKNPLASITRNATK